VAGVAEATLAELALSNARVARESDASGKTGSLSGAHPMACCDVAENPVPWTCDRPHSHTITTIESASTLFYHLRTVPSALG